jgi:hypothetical protein
MKVEVETTVNSSTPLKLRGRMYLVGASVKEEAEYGTYPESLRRPGRLTGLPNGPDEDMPGPQHMTAQRSTSRWRKYTMDSYRHTNSSLAWGGDEGASPSTPEPWPYW